MAELTTAELIKMLADFGQNLKSDLYGRFEALSEQFDQRFKEMDQRVDQRFTGMEQRFDQRFEIIEQQLSTLSNDVGEIKGMVKLLDVKAASYDR